MGSYDFTDATTGDVVTVEYTFGYKRCADGKPRIFLHHSSVPYPKPAPAVKAAAPKVAAKAEKKVCGGGASSHLCVLIPAPLCPVLFPFYPPPCRSRRPPLASPLSLITSRRLP